MLCDPHAVSAGPVVMVQGRRGESPSWLAEKWLETMPRWTLKLTRRAGACAGPIVRHLSDLANHDRARHWHETCRQPYEVLRAHVSVAAVGHDKKTPTTVTDK